MRKQPLILQNGLFAIACILTQWILAAQCHVLPQKSVLQPPEMLKNTPKLPKISTDVLNPELVKAKQCLLLQHLLIKQLHATAWRSHRCPQPSQHCTT